MAHVYAIIVSQLYDDINASITQCLQYDFFNLFIN